MTRRSIAERYRLGERVPSPDVVLAEDMGSLKDALSCHILIYVARRAYCVFRAAQDAGSLPPGLQSANAEGRVFSSRALDDLESDWLKGKSVAIIDDTIVTGATVESAVRFATNSGAASIQVHAIVSRISTADLERTLQPYGVSDIHISDDKTAGAEDDSLIMTVSALLNASLKQAGSFYFVDFPIFAPVTLSHEQFASLGRVHGWTMRDISSKAHGRRGIRSMTILPASAAAAGQIAMGVCGTLCTDLEGMPLGVAATKIRLLARRKSSGYEVRFMPKLVMAPMRLDWAQRALAVLDLSGKPPSTDCGFSRRVQFLLSLRVWDVFLQGLDPSLRDLSFRIDRSELRHHIPHLPGDLSDADLEAAGSVTRAVDSDPLPQFVPAVLPDSQYAGYFSLVRDAILQDGRLVEEDAASSLYGGGTSPQTTALLRHVLSAWGRPRFRDPADDEFDYRHQMSGITIAELKRAFAIDQRIDWQSVIALDIAIDRLRDSGALVARNCRFLVKAPESIAAGDLRSAHDAAAPEEKGVARVLHAAEATSLAVLPLYFFRTIAREAPLFEDFGGVDDLLSLATTIMDPTFLGIEGEMTISDLALDDAALAVGLDPISDSNVSKRSERVTELNQFARSAARALNSGIATPRLAQILTKDGAKERTTLDSYVEMVDRFEDDLPSELLERTTEEYQSFRRWLDTRLADVDTARDASTLPLELIRTVPRARACYDAFYSSVTKQSIPPSLRSEKFAKLESVAKMLGVSEVELMARPESHGVLVLHTSDGQKVVAKSTLTAREALATVLPLVDRLSTGDWTLLSWLLAPSADDPSASVLDSLSVGESITSVMDEAREHGINLK